MSCICPTCGSPFSSTGIIVSLNNNTITTERGNLRLTKTQAEIAYILSNRIGYVDKETILYNLYGSSNGGPNGYTLNTHICHMRKILRDIGIEIENIYGRGYRMVAQRQGDKMAINPVPQSTADLRWYCVRTEPNRESVAKRHLEAWIEEIYMPVCEQVRMLDITKMQTIDGKNVRVAVGTQRVTGPILRGYLFIRIAMGEAAAIEIGKTNGVLKLYPSNTKPHALLDEDFDRLRKCCDILAASTTPEENHQWMIGKILRISSGTYAGYQGECSDVVKGHAIMGLEMFKTSIPVPVPVECIDPEPVSAAPQDHVVKTALFGYKRPRKHAC